MYRVSLNKISEVNIIEDWLGFFIVFKFNIKFLAQKDKLRQYITFSTGHTT